MSDPEKAFIAAWYGGQSADSTDVGILLMSRPGGDILVPVDVSQDIAFSSSGIEFLPEWPKLPIGSIGDVPVSLVIYPPGQEAPQGYEWRSPRTLFAFLTPSMAEAVSRASMMASWDYDHRYCGRCGSETIRDTKEAVRVCPSCAHRAYPRVSPAMIVLIEAAPEAGFDEPRILLAHNRRFPDGVYSCIAGYVEAGETLESTVLREIREEVGLDAEPPQYVRSQAWPLPHSLMLGFNTTAFGTPVPDGDEIEDARWFSASDLPHIPRHGTIARTLIDDWLERIGASPYED